MTDPRGTSAIRVRFESETIWSRAARGLVGMLEGEGHSVAECAPGDGAPDLVVFGDRVRDVERLRAMIDPSDDTPKVFLCNENLLSDRLAPVRRFLRDVKHCFLLHANRIRNDGSEFGFPMGFALVNAGWLARIGPTAEDATRRDIFCAFIVSNGNDSNGRVAMLDALSAYRHVNSYGRVRNDTTFPERLAGLPALEQCFEVCRSCRFAICFENSRADNYITEKLLVARAAGAIPIYRGARNVGDFFNTRAFIDCDDHGSNEAVVETVKALDGDARQYDRMRREPFFRPGFGEALEKEKRRFVRMLTAHALRGGRPRS